MAERAVVESGEDEAQASGPATRIAPALSMNQMVDLVAAEFSRYDTRSPRAAAREIIAALLDLPRHLAPHRAEGFADPRLPARALVAACRWARGMPFQYAVGRASFRYLTLEVDPRVLIPRPETELLVDLVLAECRAAPGGVVIDVGTGSGAIAIALAQEGAFHRVIATDISLDALSVARHNASAIGTSLITPIEFRHGSLLAPVGEVRARAVVANPPYIAFDEASSLPASVRDWEPPVALLSADNGLADTARLIRQAGAQLEDGGLLALELDARKASLVSEMVSADGRYADVTVRLDLAGRERFLFARRRGRETQ
jgi:release factor glutamine methyltransferase